MPGQWTPVHDHGSWGVVGVVEGVLEERSYVGCRRTAAPTKASTSRAAAWCCCGRAR
jgi:predicted metal-dependent enzyme (double-stranded beta helix superfamily)